MMVPAWMMGGGGYGGFDGYASHHAVTENKGGKGKGKGKGGKGAKAGGKGKGGMVMQMCQPCGYEDLTWQNPQPEKPCSKCCSKDHTKNQCPYRNHLCESCNKYGHTPDACWKARGLKTCACCGRDNHETKDCSHKEKECNICKKLGHLASVCTAGAADTKKQNVSTTTAQTTDEEKKESWCSQCGTFNKVDVKYCTKCKKKREVDTEKPDKPLKPQAETVAAWGKRKPEDGEMELDPVDKEVEDTKTQLEGLILMLKGMTGKADMLKQAEDDLKELQKKKPVHTLEKDCVSVSKSLQDATSRAARLIAQAEQKLAKKLKDQSDLEETHDASLKSLKEVYETRTKAIQEEYVKEKKKREEEVEQEKVKVKETKVEQEEMVAKARLALTNVTAATTGTARKPEDGPPSAAPGVAPGVVLVPALPGNMIHSNDVALPELQEIVYNDPRLTGVTPEMVVAFTAVIMDYMQMKSTVVAAGQVGAEPPREENAEGSQQQEEDPMTSDDEENELIDANKKGDEVMPKAKISRSAKAARKVKAGKGVVTTASSTTTVKSTIVKQSS